MSDIKYYKIPEDSSAATAANMATADLTLTGNRGHDLDGNKLTFKTSSATGGYLGIRNSETTSGVECLKIWSEISPRYTYINNVQNSLFLGGSGDLNQLELANGYAKYKSRVIIIPDGPVGDAYLQVRGGSGAASSAKLFLVESSASSEAFKITNDRQTHTKRLNVTGLGSTNVTTALLVENSSGTELLKVLDDGTITGNFSADNMATADLTLTGNRIHDLDGNTLQLLTDTGSELEIKKSGITGGLKMYQIAGGTSYINNGAATLFLGAGGNNILGLNGSLGQFYSDLKIGIGHIGGTGARLKVRGSNSSSGTYTVLFENSGGLEAFRIENDRQTYTKRLNVKGLGSTNATTALLVENSSSTQLLKIDDAGGFALGLGAAYGDKTNVAIGDGATANNTYSIAIGDGATSTSFSGIAIGGNTDTGGGYNVVIGYGASASSTGSAIGYLASATSGSSLAIGSNSSSASSGVAIGKNALNAGYGVALGFDAESTVNGSGLAIGNKAKVTQFNSMIFSASTYGATRTNSVRRTAEFYLDLSTPTFRFGSESDGWLDSSGNFAIGKTTGINEKLDVVGNIASSGQIYSYQASTINVTANSSTFDGNNGNSQPLDLASATGDITLTFTNLKAGGTYFIPVTQKSSSPVNIGTYTISGGTVKFPSGTAPTISTGASEIDSLVCYYDGTDLLVNYSQNYS